jgi:hypothetical protein
MGKKNPDNCQDILGKLYMFRNLFLILFIKYTKTKKKYKVNLKIFIFMDVEKIIFEFFESRDEIKNKFYDSLYKIIFDKNSNDLKNLLNTYESDIVEFKKKKSSQIKKK